MFDAIIRMGGNNVVDSDLFNTRVVLTSADTASDNVADFLFFTPYLASDFPEVTCDKTYFFLYSTDHDSPGGIEFGGCYWGKGDYLDLRDFEELGVIVQGLQAETPMLIRFPDNAPDVLHFYYHVQFDRGISVNDEQETRLITTTGGLLHTATWTDAVPINCLGDDLPQDHTGYLRVFNVEGTLKGTHYKQQSLPAFITGEVQVSTTVNGFDWVRGISVDLDSYCDAGRFVFPSYGGYFKKYNQWWCIITSQAKVGSGVDTATRGLILCKADNTLQILSKVKDLNFGTINVVSWFIYTDETDVAQIYGCHRVNETMSHSTLDLTQLLLYL